MDLSCLLLPGGLLCWAREDGDCFELIETAADSALVMLPAHAGVVVDKGSLSEGVCASGCLGRESRGGASLRGVLRHSSRERVGSGGSGLEGSWGLLHCKVGLGLLGYLLEVGGGSRGKGRRGFLRRATGEWVGGLAS